MRKLIFGLLLLLCVAPLLAQDDCPVIVKTALGLADEVCSGTARNQACYGNIQLEAIPQPGAADFAFSRPGDIADLVNVQSLRLSSLNEAANQWGVAVMRVQANLPDTLPGQNVTFLLFGDVEIGTAGNAEPVLLDAVSNGDINVRSGPSTRDKVAGSLASGQTVKVDGRLEDSSWLHIQLSAGAGWVRADLVKVSGDVSTLSVTNPVTGAVVAAAPANTAGAFYFRSGVGETACAEAPNGLLIQTPKGSERVSLTINGVDLTLGSTAFIEASPENQMTISMLTGVAQVGAGGQTQTTIQGTQVSVPIDENGIASGAPSEPEPLDEGIEPFVIDVNDTGLITPTMDDTSDLLAPAIREGLIVAPTRENPIIATPKENIARAIQLTNEALAQRVPKLTQGTWVRKYGETVVTGTCLSTAMGYGDGNGGFDPDDPANHATLCNASRSDGMPVTVLDSSSYRWNAAGFYEGESFSIRDPLMKNGIQTGILTTTISRTLEIIDATHLRVTVTSQEENGCTVTTPIDYELREASDAVCVDVRVDEPAQTTSTAPTIAPGKYQVAFPVFGADCNADNSPAFTAVDLSFDTSGSMVLAYDGGSYTLFSDGSGFYSYQEMKNGFFSVQVYPLGDYLNLSWSKYGGGRNCFLTGEMRLEGSQSGGLQITEGNYAASWTPDATCDPALKDAAPDFTTASLTRPAGLSIQLDFAGGSYTANQISPGAYSYSQFGADGSGVMLRFTVLSETEMEASFYVSNAGGKFCSGRGQLTLAE